MPKAADVSQTCSIQRSSAVACLALCADQAATSSSCNALPAALAWAVHSSEDAGACHAPGKRIVRIVYELRQQTSRTTVQWMCWCF